MSPAVWTLHTSALLALRNWGGETLAHHVSSNDTHRLDGRVGWVLEALSHGQPQSILDLLAIAPFEADEEGLQQDLLTLERLGFARQC